MTVLCPEVWCSLFFFFFLNCCKRLECVICPDVTLCGRLDTDIPKLTHSSFVFFFPFIYYFLCFLLLAHKDQSSLWPLLPVMGRTWRWWCQENSLSETTSGPSVKNMSDLGHRGEVGGRGGRDRDSDRGTQIHRTVTSFLDTLAQCPFDPRTRGHSLTLVSCNLTPHQCRPGQSSLW